MTSSQTKRFAKWLNLAPPQTRYLGSRVESSLVPPLEKLGFTWASDIQLTSGRELEFERAVGEFVDTVTFNFDKYRAPRFQVQIARRAASPPNAFVRSCNLVASAKLYLYFWGKPWWYPTAYWPNHRTDRVVEALERHMAQAANFLESGARGPNISRPTSS